METPTTTTPRRRGRPRKVAPDGVAVAERALEPQEAIIERSIAEGEKIIRRRIEMGIFSHASSEIKMKDARLSARWFNQEQNSHRIYQATDAAWHPVTPDMVENIDALGVYTLNESGHIVRGNRGAEHLMWQTKDQRRRVLQRKTEENDRMLGSNKKAKAQMVEAASVELGEEAAEFLEKSTFGEVTDSIERIEQLDPEHV